MNHLDPISRLVAMLTGRSVDQHAVDPVSAAAHLPAAAPQLRHVRAELLLAVDALRTLLINGDDLRSGAGALLRGPVEDIGALARQYRTARDGLDALIDDDERERYAATAPARQVQRRYVKPGDTVLVVLPHTEWCRTSDLAGRRTRVTVYDSDAELDLPIDPGQRRLSHPDAGIYHDPATARLYVLAAETSAATQA